MNKKLTKNIAISGLLMVAVIGIGLYTNVIKLPITKVIDPLYVADFSDDRVLVGASHNVFVGKVSKQIGDKNLDGIPETQFAVDVLSNIKGDLQGTVTVDQEGGYKNGVLYLVKDGDVIVPSAGNDGGLLVPGSTYLFTTRYNEGENWYTLISHPRGRKLINQDKLLDKVQIEKLAKNDKRVKELQEAYKNEILLDTDVKNNNTRNSFQSLPKK